MGCKNYSIFQSQLASIISINFIILTLYVNFDAINSAYAVYNEFLLELISHPNKQTC
jgi:hypothetical protein